MTRQKKLTPKEYINTTNKEVNERIKFAVEKLLPSEKDNIELISNVDDSIKPVIIVLISDILGGDHQKAVNNAALHRIKDLTSKSIQTGVINTTQPPNINIFDTNSIAYIVQNIPAVIDMINTSVGSVIECYGRNINQGYNNELVDYSVMCTIGGNCNCKNNVPETLKEIGITIGKIITEKKSNDTYNRFNKLIKKLPNNKYRRILKEYIDSIYNSEDLPLAEKIVVEKPLIDNTKDTSTEIKPEDVKFNTEEE